MNAYLYIYFYFSYLSRSRPSRALEALDNLLLHTTSRIKIHNTKKQIMEEIGNDNSDLREAPSPMLPTPASSESYYGDIISSNSAEQFLSTSTTDVDGNYSTAFFHTKLLLDTFSSRQLTVLLSSISVVVLLAMGLCLCACVRYWKKRIRNNNYIYEQHGSVDGSGSQRSLCFPKKGEKFRIVPHKNIFTPDQSVSFVVPTVSVPLQSQTRDNREPSMARRLSASRSLLEITTTSLTGSDIKVPMLEQPYYPQLHQEDMSPKLALSIFYSVSSQILYVKIICGQNFPQGVAHSVKVKLYPGRGAKQRTKECDGIIPEFYEEFNFHVRKYVVHTKVLKLRVVGAGINEKGDTEKSLLGCVNIPLMDLKGLDKLDILEDYRTGTMWKKLDQVSSTSEGVKLCVSLLWSMEPSPGLLTLKIIQASGLHEFAESDYTSSYVKVTLQEHGKNMKARKTRLIRWGSVPNYDDTFVVTLPYQLLSQISFLLVVIARGRLGSKVVLGKISIGPVPFASPSSGAGTAFWEDMCHQPNVEIVRCLQLVP